MEAPASAVRASPESVDPAVPHIMVPRIDRLSTAAGRELGKRRERNATIIPVRTIVEGFGEDPKKSAAGRHPAAP